MWSIDLDLQGHIGLKLTDFFCKFELVGAITCQVFDLESSFFAQHVYLGTNQNPIDLDLQGHFGVKLIDFRKFELRTITCQGFELGSPFLQRICILGPIRTVNGVEGHFLKVISQKRVDRLISDENHLDW